MGPSADLFSALLFSDKVVELWQANQERCYETVTSKILPALQKLEDENDRVFARLQHVCDVWNARRIRIPEEMLAWTRG